MLAMCSAYFHLRLCYSPEIENIIEKTENFWYDIEHNDCFVRLVRIEVGNVC